MFQFACVTSINNKKDYLMSLKEKLLAEETRPKLLSDCVLLLDSEVSRKSGISGLAIKSAYNIIKKVKPTIVSDAMDDFLDLFVEKLEPLYELYTTKYKTMDIQDFFNAKKDEVAKSLLSITDERAKVAKNALLKSTYEKLRPVAEKNIEEAVPALVVVLNKYRDFNLEEGQITSVMYEMYKDNN